MKTKPLLLLAGIAFLFVLFFGGGAVWQLPALVYLGAGTPAVVALWKATPSWSERLTAILFLLFLLWGFIYAVDGLSDPRYQ